MISQPIIYLIQDLTEGTELFKTYYSTWFIWTILCILMGYIGFYMKKNKWWGLLILSPMIVLLGFQYNYYLSDMMFSFPRHLLTVIFCLLTSVIYPIYIFDNKIIKRIGLIISIIIMLVMTIMALSKKTVYSTDILISNNNHTFDSTCTVKIEDENIGTLSIKYEKEIDTYFIHADFVKEGNTTFILDCPNKDKKVFDLMAKINTYEVKEKND